MVKLTIHLVTYELKHGVYSLHDELDLTVEECLEHLQSYRQVWPASKFFYNGASYKTARLEWSRNLGTYYQWHFYVHGDLEEQKQIWNTIQEWPRW